jgi:hypothetical protein
MQSDISSRHIIDAEFDPIGVPEIELAQIPMQMGL